MLQYFHTLYHRVLFNRSRKSDNLSLLTESLVNDHFTVVVDRDLFGNRSTVSLEASTADLARPLTGWSCYFFISSFRNTSLSVSSSRIVHVTR